MEFEELMRLIAGALNVPVEKVRMESSLKKDLGADSLDVFQIVIGIEEELKVKVDPTEAEKLRTVGDVYKMTQRMTSTR